MILRRLQFNLLHELEQEETLSGHFIRNTWGGGAEVWHEGAVGGNMEAGVILHVECCL